MTAWRPPSWFFGALAGGIAGLILLIGFIAGILKFVRDHRVERDLEANNHAASPESRITHNEKVEVSPDGGNEGGIRSAVENDMEFVDVDLRDPSIRSLSVYAKVRDSLSRSSIGSRSKVERLVAVYALRLIVPQNKFDVQESRVFAARKGQQRPSKGGADLESTISILFDHLVLENTDSVEFLLQSYAESLDEE
ncbi:MAG: hypothetical protein Q9219_003218 [cf. Caloplaca sp. 3 TL-2023]